MPDICLYFQVHQPRRLRRFRVFDIGTGADYFDAESNHTILQKVAEKCYLPANRLLGELIRDSAGTFRVAFSLSGTLLEQLAADAPEVLASFQELAAGGGVEILGETYDHSLASVGNAAEFVQQVEAHRRAIGLWFGQSPTVFRNTELIYSDALAPLVARLGFRAILVEGVDRVLGGRSPNFVYRAATAPVKLLPRNYRLSDDVGFRFSDRSWPSWPLTADRFVDWIASSPDECVNLFLDYETFGEHHWADSGIFEFLRRLPLEAERRGVGFLHPSELAGREARDTLSFPELTSWADLERDLSAWLGNRLQWAAHERVYRLRGQILTSGDPELRRTWRRLTTSDHFYYMCTKWFADGDVHKYFNPYETPYDAFLATMNVLEDLEQRCGALRQQARERARLARERLGRQPRARPRRKRLASTSPS